MAMSTKKLQRVIEQTNEGWKVSFTRGGHLVCRHPDAAVPVYSSSTPSDGQRHMLELRQELRRSLKAGQEARSSR